MSSRIFRLLFLLGLFGLLPSVTPATVAAQAASPVHLMLTRSGYLQRAANAPDSPSALYLLYHGGPVMHTVSAYTIYWDPGNNIPAGYMTLIDRYFQDIGGSTFYGLMTQYYEGPGVVNIQNVSTHGGTWHDTTNAYSPRPGTAANPLTDADIRAEVSRAITANSWPTGVTNMYFVYTEQGIESCADASHCTPGTAHPAYCAYHGHFLSGGQQVIYANQPYDETWTTQCRAFFTSPNSDMAADSTISITSHEHFEAVTDPLFNAWYDSNGDEIGDRCAYIYGSLAGDGSNQTLNGHAYITQLEWSNSVAGCVKSYNPRHLFLPLILKGS